MKGQRSKSQHSNLFKVANLPLVISCVDKTKLDWLDALNLPALFSNNEILTFSTTIHK